MDLQWHPAGSIQQDRRARRIRMGNRSRARTGFTLVEVLMVAVILAILAVVVVPQFSDASTDVKTSALRATLQTVRSQLELYKAQHNGEYPPAPENGTWDEMTKKTDVSGDPDALEPKYGPYLLSIPVNPVDDKADMVTGQDGTGGWAYDPNTGVFKSNDDTVMSADSVTKSL
jgi:general secretion pathway protein G